MQTVLEILQPLISALAEIKEIKTLSQKIPNEKQIKIDTQLSVSSVEAELKRLAHKLIDNIY